jgi:hypothetical protein
MTAFEITILAIAAVQVVFTLFHPTDDLIAWVAKWIVIGWDKARMYFEKEPQPLTNADLEKIAEMLQSGSTPVPNRQIIIDGFSTLSPAGKRSIKRSMGCIARYSQNHGEYFSFTVRT